MIKFAVVGQGHIGKRHAEMIRRNPDSELVAVCDTLPKEKLGLNDIGEIGLQRATRWALVQSAVISASRINFS